MAFQSNKSTLETFTTVKVKKKVTRSIFLGTEDKAALKEMIEKYNVEFNTQTTPSGSDGSVLVDIKNYL